MFRQPRPDLSLLRSITRNHRRAPTKPRLPAVDQPGNHVTVGFVADHQLFARCDGVEVVGGEESVEKLVVATRPLGLPFNYPDAISGGFRRALPSR